MGVLGEMMHSAMMDLCMLINHGELILFVVAIHLIVVKVGRLLYHTLWGWTLSDNIVSGCVIRSDTLWRENVLSARNLLH